MSTTFITPTNDARPTEGVGIVTTTSTGLFGPILAAICALPSNNTVTAEFAITRTTGGGERWERTFGPHRRSTLIRWTPTGFVEQLGPLRLTFDTPASGRYTCSRMQLGPLVVPRLVAITVVIESGRTAVDIAVGGGRLGTFSYHALIGAIR